MQVWWIPQVPMTPFVVPVETELEANLLLDTLAAYDFFQLENKIKPDFCNMGGLHVWVADSDGEGTPGWEDWENIDTGETFDEYRRENLPCKFSEIKAASGIKG